MSGQIFISYRRDDSSASAGRLYDRLLVRLPNNPIFIDVDLDPGIDFVEAIEASVSSCAVLIAVIGKRWLRSSVGKGKRRLENPEDFVRVEIATALKRNIRVIPVLVDGALMPRSSDLPDDLSLLARRNALEISHNRFNADFARLVTAIKGVVKKAEAEGKQPEKTVAPTATIAGKAKATLMRADDSYEKKDYGNEISACTKANARAIGLLIEAAFTEDEFRIFCSTHFRELETKITSLESHSHKVLALIQFAALHGGFPTLLAKIEKERPREYMKFARRLTSGTKPQKWDSPSPGLVFAYYINFLRPIVRTICNIRSNNFSEVIDVGDLHVGERQMEKIRLDIILPKKLDENYHQFVVRDLLPTNVVRLVKIKFRPDGRPLTIYALSNQQSEEYFRLFDFFPPFLKVLEEALDHRFSVKYPKERRQPWFKAAESEMKYLKRGLHELAQLHDEEVGNSKWTRFQVIALEDIFPMFGSL
jgi:hypothetical protein